MSCTMDPATHTWTQPGGATCTETHCTARDKFKKRCTRHVAPTELSCGKCIGTTRDDLQTIVTLSARMLTEAIHRGTESEAAYLAGPTADPRMLDKRRTLIRRAIAEYNFDIQERLIARIPDDDPHHPFAVTGRWELMIREDYGPDTDHRINIVDAAAYLDTRLHRMANDPAQDFPLFVREITTCRSHLERVLHDSRHGDRGAPCHLCGTGTFVRKHDEARIQFKTKQGETVYGDHLRDVDGHKIPDDYWQCDNCRARMSDTDYRRVIQASHVATADRLTLTDMATRTRIPKGTLDRWASGWQPKNKPRIEPLITPCGRNDSGTKLYRVGDILTIRDTPDTAEA